MSSAGANSSWLADRGFEKLTVNAGAQAPGIGDFTIIIGDHDARGNPINNMSRDLCWLQRSYSNGLLENGW